MSWYSKTKQAMALDPNLWRTDPDPHRLPEHRDVQRTPYGNFRQPQEIEKLEFWYSGVHFTDSLELAAAYAQGKSSQEDPPVVIEVYRDTLTPIPDVDAVNFSDSVHVALSEGEFSEILDNEELDSGEKFSQILNKLQKNLEYSDGNNEDEDPADFVAGEARDTAESAVMSYLQNISDYDQAINEFRAMLNGHIPDKILISMANQFRVMTAIESDQVHAIHQIPRVNLDDFKNLYQLEEMDEEELEDEGVTKIGKDFFDDDGRLLLDYEFLEYGSWVKKTPLYQDKKQTSESDLTYHGTSLSRAKSAYPELLP